MQSAWVEADALATAAQLAARGVGEDLALRVYTTRLLGRDPRLVLQRGYALLTDAQSGQPITSAAQAHADQLVRAALADGEVDLRVVPAGPNRP